MPWKKGETGNPGGRRKASATFQVRMLAQQYTEQAITKLAAWMDSDIPQASVKACEILLERGWGKPTAAIEEEMLRAKVKLLEQGHDPDDHSITIVVPALPENPKKADR